MNNKAQLQIMENAFALLIIFIIMIIVGVFAFAWQRGEAIETEKEFAELEVLKKSWILNFLPEMQCSDNNNIEPDCYDLLKVDAFARKVEEQRASESDYYEMLLGYVNISIEWYDPSPDVDHLIAKWWIYDNPKKDSKNVRMLPLPLTLRDAVNNSDYFGIVYLGVYE